MKFRRYYNLKTEEDGITVKNEVIKSLLLNQSHNDIHKKVCILGWNSVIHAEKFLDRFKIVEFYEIKENKKDKKIIKENFFDLENEKAKQSSLNEKKEDCDSKSKASVNNTPVTHVATRGVNTCTFVYLDNGEDIWLFHLDCDFLECGIIKDIFKDLNRKCTEGALPLYNCVISRVEGNEENKFSDYLLEQASIANLYEFNRGREPYGDDKGLHLDYVMHAEIGVFANSGNPILYGDITSQELKRKLFLDYDKNIEVSPILNTFKKAEVKHKSSSSSTPSSSSSSAAPSSATPKSD